MRVIADVGRDMTTTISTLNLATAIFDENKNGGIMICGINWGGDPSDKPNPEKPSFFSDATVNNYPYRNRLLRWFQLWGQPLQTARGEDGPFERSIVQTNWLPDQERTMHGQDIFRKCIEQKDNFFAHVRALRPRVILFCGSTLIRVLNDPSCIEDATACLGSPDKMKLLTKNVLENGKTLKRFRIGLQRFEHCNVVAVPHPTGSKGLSDSYIAAFRSEVWSVFEDVRRASRAQHGAPPDAANSAARVS